ncbi:MAG: hypothetical protein WC838_03935, partial [Candidatus Margulisiibacteriota bacterium]
ASVQRYNVLAHPLNGIMIPVYTEQKVFASNWLWTERLQDKKALVDKFFDLNTEDAWRKEFLDENKIRYIYYGNLERRLGQFDPARTDYLYKTFSNRLVAIYYKP